MERKEVTAMGKIDVVIVGGRPNEQKMMDVLVSVERVEWLLKDLHYRANDEWFYALHALAERIDFGSVEDDLKECYWMGALCRLPPDEATIHAMVVDLAGRDESGAGLSNRDLLQAVMDAASAGVAKVEVAKGIPVLPGGVHAILDEASKALLRAKALCWRSLLSGVPVDCGTPEESLGRFLAVAAGGK